MWGDRRAGHRHVRRTFANFLRRGKWRHKNHNQRTCLPDGLCSGKAPQRGFLPTLCPYALPRDETSWKSCRNRNNRCLSVTGLSRLSRWPLALLPSDGEPLCTAKLKAILYDTYLSISCLPQGPSMKACLGLAKQLSSGNAAHLTNLIEF